MILPASRKYPRSVVLEAYEMHAACQTITAAAAALAVPHGTLTAWAQRGCWGPWRGRQCRYYTDEDREQARELVARGLSPAEIERRTGINHSTVRDWERSYHWPRPDMPDGKWPLGVAHTDATKERVRQLVLQGCTRVEIEQETGVYRGTITKWRKRYGWGPQAHPDGWEARDCATCPDKTACRKLNRDGRILPCYKYISPEDALAEQLFVRARQYMMAEY